MKKFWSWLVPDGTTKLRARALLVLALVTLALYVPGQIGLPAMDRDEARYAQATKQMLASGDFIDIKFADQTRYLQPVGIYWLQAATTLPFGGERAGIWAFRLPSLISALLTVLLVAWFGTRLYGPNVGLAAGFILAPSLLLAGEAHFAKIDATLLLMTTIAQVALYLTLTPSPFQGEGRGEGANKESPDGANTASIFSPLTQPSPQGGEGNGLKPHFIGWPLVFWLAIGAGGLLKGPIILLIVGLTIIAYGIWQKEWRYLLTLNPILGVLIVAAMIAPWLIAIDIKTNGGFFRQALGHSLGYKVAHGEQGHGQPPGYHTLLFMLTFFPGVVLAGLGGYHAWHNRGDRFVRFLLCWIVPAWLMFELVATKLPHYTLPVFPAIALLAALGLKDAGEHLARPAGRWWHLGALVLFLVAASAVTALPIVAARQLHEPITPFVVAASVFGFAILIGGVVLWWRPRAERLMPLLGATILAYVVMFQIVVPSFDPLWVSEQLGRIAGQLEGCGHVTVATAGFSEPSAVVQFGASTVLGDGKTAAQHLATHPACGIAIVESRERIAFQAELQAEKIDVQKFGSVTGLNYVKGKAVELDIYGTAASALELPGTVHDSDPDLD